MFRTWWQKVFSFPRTRLARRRGYRPPTRLLGRTTRLSMTALEDRVTPAHNLTIGGAVTAGVTIDTVTTPGTTIFIATADNASVSTSDFVTAASTGPVVATSDLGGTQAGNITNELAASIGGGTLNLTFLTASNATVGDIVFNQFFGAVGAGAVNYTVNAKHDIVFNTADVSFNTGTATLVAGNAIVQTSGSLQGSNLALTAATGIGTVGTPFLTQASNLEAQTATGGIFITNTGALIVGGVSAALGGVRVTTSGDIVLTNTGSVSIVTAGEIVRSPGNVTVRALGAAADLTTGGNNNGVILQAGAVQSLNGNIIVEAGRDVLAGGPSLGDVLADAGAVTMTAGRDVSVTNGTTVGNFTNVGGLTVTAGRNITANSTGNVVAPFNTAGSLITLTTGAGGTFSVTGAVPGVDASSNTFNDGNIVISADDMVIAAPIAADDAIVTLRTASDTRLIDLGTNSPGNLGLTDAELDNVTAAALRIDNRGTDPSAAASIFITSPITAGPGYSTLHLLTELVIADLTPAEQADLVVTNLALEAALGISFGGNDIDIDATNLAFVNAASGQVVVSDTAGGLNITSVDGIATSSAIGDGSITAASPLTIAMNTTVGGSFTFTAAGSALPGDDLTIADGVTVTLNSATNRTLRFEAGDDIVFQGTGNVQTTGGGTHTVQLVADLENNVVEDGGTVTQDTTTTVSVTTNNLEITPRASIGTAATRFHFNVDALTTSSTLGSQFLREANGVTLASVVANGAGNDVDLVADLGDITVQVVTVADDVTLTATAGNIFDDASDATGIIGDLVSLTAVRSIGQPGAVPDIDIDANTLVAATTGAGPFTGAPTPGIWVTDVTGLVVTSATTQDGVILIDAGGNLTATLVNAGGTGRNVRLRALSGDLTVGSVTAAGDVVALGASGAIIDGDAANDVTALSLLLSAGTGIAAAADPLETTVSNIAWSAGTGGIDLVNAGPLTIAAVTAFGATVTGGSGTGAATVTATSPLTVAADVVMGGTVTLTAGEIADAPACADDLTVNAGVTVQSTGANVVLQAGDDVILGAGAVITAAGSVTITAGFGDLDNCGGFVDNGATITAGAAVAICTIDDLTVGTITAPGQTVTLRSINGSILDGNGAAINVTAAALAMQANTGVGVGVDGALETVVNNAEALTTTGGIFLTNVGDLTVGGVVPDPTCITAILTGLTVTTAGGVDVTSSGSIILADTNGAQIVKAGDTAGDVTLTAGVDVRAAVDRDAITAPAGSITVIAGQDVLLGTAGANFDNDVRANGSVTFIAGRDVVVDGFSDVAADDFLNNTGGAVTFVAGGNITLGPTALNDVSVTARTGPVLLITGVNGVFTLTNGATVSTTGGDITVEADNVTIDATSTINAAAGIVTIQQVSAGQAIDLGGPDAAGTLGLTDAELDRVTTTSVLRIGRNDGTFTGAISVTNPITQAGSGYTRLSLRTGAAVTESGAGSITVDELAVRANGTVTLGGANDVTQLAVFTATGNILYRDVNGFNVGAVDGVSGLAAPGTVTLNAGGAVTQTQIISAAGLELLGAGPYNLGGLVNAVPVIAANTTEAISFRTGGALTVDTVNTVGITTTNDNIELCADAGPLTLAQNVTIGTGTLRLQSGNGIIQTGGTITAAALGAVTTAGDITLTAGPNAVPVLAINSAGNFTFNAAGPFVFGVVTAGVCFAGANGLAFSANGDVTICQATGNLNVGTAITTAGTVRLTTFDGNITQTAGITAGTLGAVAGGAAASAVLLDSAPNAVGVFSAQAQADVRFTATGGFTVGAVTANICFPGSDGARSIVAGNIFLTNTSVNPADPGITISRPVIATNGNVTITSNAVEIGSNVVAGGLAAGCVTLQPLSAGQAITLGAEVAGTFSLTDAELDFVTAGANPEGGLLVGSVTAGDLTIAGPVSQAGSGYTKIGLLTGANVNEDIAAGSIAVDQLSVRAGASVNMCGTNLVGTLAGRSTGAFRFVNGQTYTVGTVTVCNDAVLGVATTNADIDLVSTVGPIALVQPVNAGTGSVRINSGGALTQTAAGLITGQDLAVRANGTVDLCQAVNNVTGMFAAVNIGPAAAVMFRNGPSITVGAIVDGVCAPGAAGVTTDNGDIDLVSGGAITFPNSLNAGSGTVRLNAGTTVAQGGGTVAAANLAVRANGNVDLCQVANAVTGTFAAVNTGAGAFVRFLNGPGFTVGAVADDACAVGATGVTTTNGPVELRSQSGTISLANALNAGTAPVHLQANGTVSQIAAGTITAGSLAVNSAAGSILLDQANGVDVLAAFAPAGDINFQTTRALRLDTVAAGACADGAVGVRTVPLNLPLDGTLLGTVRLQTAGGLTQAPVAAGVAPGAVATATIGARNITAGDISLLATDYTAPGGGAGNRVGTFAADNSAPNGRVDLAVLRDLTLGDVTAAGTFALVHGIRTSNGGSNLRTGNDFTAIDHGLPANDPTQAGVIINLGTGAFLLNPGQSPTLKMNAMSNVITFNAEAIAGSFRLGAPKGTEPPIPNPPVGFPPIPANPTATTPLPPLPAARDNVLRETFNVRPSRNVQIIVNGNDPTDLPGDTLNPILFDLEANETPISLVRNEPGSGRFDFGNGALRRSLLFTGIERIAGLSIVATATQTGPATYSIGAFGTIQGFQLTGGLTGGQAPLNPFIVSPNLVNPFQPFGAPRLAVGDFNGDGTPDLIIGNGPGDAPLVSVVDGNRLFIAPHPLVQQDLLSQFFAYDPNFRGGLFVAAGNLNNAANGQVEIVTGPDVGGGPHVRVFRYNATPGLNIFNNVVDNAVNNPTPFPLGGFFAYAAGFTGGVRVAVGDVNGDGTPDIITGTGPGGGPHVKVFSGANGGVFREFFAYDPAFRGGVFVAAGDYDADGRADILTGAGAGGGPHVRVFSGAGGLLADFFAFGPDSGSSLFGPDVGLTTGVGSVAFGDVDGNGSQDILVTTARGPRTRLRAFRRNGLAVQQIDLSNIPNFVPPIPFAFDPTTDEVIAPGLRDGSNVGGASGA